MCVTLVSLFPNWMTPKFPDGFSTRQEYTAIEILGFHEFTICSRYLAVTVLYASIIALNLEMENFVGDNVLCLDLMCVCAPMF